MLSLASNRFKTAMAEGLINFGQIGIGQGASDTFKAIIMNSSYVFNKITHAKYSDVSSHELSSGHGYSQGSYIVGSKTLSFDAANTYYNIILPPLIWTATEGSLGPLSGVIIYDDTITDKIIVCFLDFESLVTIESGNQLFIMNATIQL